VSALAAALLGVTVALVAVPASQATPDNVGATGVAAAAVTDVPAPAVTDPPPQPGGTVTELGMPIVGGQTSPDLA